MMISAVLAVRDEEDLIEGALRSLAFCDEIVVVIDDRTSDRTEEIARRFTANVHRVPFAGFADLFNAGLERAQGDWIVFCDADERITPKLARSLRERVEANPRAWAFRVRRVNFYWGRRMEHGGWREQLVGKVTHRDHARYEGDVHPTQTIPPDRIEWLEGELWHFSHRSIEENLRKAIQYGKLDAAARYEAGAAAVTPVTFLRVMLYDFARRGIRRLGALDGMPGLIEVIFQPFAMFCGAVMLWERQRAAAISARYEELERQVREQT